MKRIIGTSEVKRSQPIFRVSRWKICSTREIRWQVQALWARLAWATQSAPWCISRRRPTGRPTWTTWFVLVAWKRVRTRRACPMSQPQDTSQSSILRYYRFEMKTVIQRCWINLPKMNRMQAETCRIASIVALQAMIMNMQPAWVWFPRSAVVAST